MTLHRLAIAGPPRQRGRQYGEGLRAAIYERDRAWKEHLGIYSGIAPEDFIDAHLAQSHYLAAAAQWTPDLLEEVKGLAEGANLTFEHAFAAQLMDEEWLFWESFRGRHHCSSLGSASADGSFAVAAQNMDLPQWMDGSQTVLTVTDPATGLTAIVLTAAGMIGLTGMNSAGLGVVVNTLAELPASTSGLPVAFVTRGLLAQRDVAAARRFLAAIPHAAGQNYIVADAQGAEDYECSAEGCQRFRPPQATERSAWHTNHPLAGGHLVHGAELAATGGTANSLARLAALDARFGADGGAFDLATVRAALASRDHAAYPVSRPRSEAAGDHGFTFAAVVWQLAPEPKAEVAPGPPHQTAYQAFGFPSGHGLRAAE